MAYPGHFEVDESSVSYVLDDWGAMLSAGSVEELRDLAHAILAGPLRRPAVDAAARGALRTLRALARAGRIRAWSGVGLDG